MICYRSGARSYPSAKLDKEDSLVNGDSLEITGLSH